MSYRLIAQTLNVPLSTVGYIIKKWKTGGTTEIGQQSGVTLKFQIKLLEE